MLIRSVSVALLAVASMYAQATPVVPSPGASFGTLVGATFNPLGASGIPNTAVAFRSFSHEYDVDAQNNNSPLTTTITLGLTAHGRFTFNPPLTNNGAGVFNATAGENDLGANTLTPDDDFATWNFGFYIDTSSGNLVQMMGGAHPLTFQLFYDTDPTVGNDISTYGRIEFNSQASSPTQISRIQDSYNLDMDFLNDGVAGVVFAPGGLGFDPTVSGEYGFVLRTTDENNTVQQSAILVNVGTPGTNVPEPGTLALVGLALAGMGAMRGRRKA